MVFLGPVARHIGIPKYLDDETATILRRKDGKVLQVVSSALFVCLLTTMYQIDNSTRSNDSDESFECTATQIDVMPLKCLFVGFILEST
jgi:hypothetical protein